MSDRSGAPLIHARGVWKIFGRHADKVMGTPDADLPRSELREKHGCVAAVRDVSFDVWPGEIFVVMGLSGGMQQRVGLARAFAVDPKVMLYDEPFSALDPLIRRDMQDEVIRLQRETGKTMVFITHDLPEALRLGDRIAIMRDGAIVQLGTPEELVGSPADDYVSNFVRDIPRSHVLTLRWIMRDPAPGEEEGPRLDVRTTVRSAVPVTVESEKPVRAVDNGRVVGVVDKEAVLTAIAGDSG